MIKHRHFVALLAALALVLAGCESTDQAVRAAVSSLQEENTVVPLGKVDNSKSGEKSTVKVPSSSTKKDDGKIEDDQTGKTDDQTGKTDDQTGKTDEETGKTDNQTGKTDNQTSKTDDETGKTDDQTGKTDDQTGKTDDQTSKTDDETGKTDNQTGKTDDETSKTDDQTGKTDDQTGKTDDETGKTDDQTGKTDDQTGKTDDETGKTDDQTGKTDDETGKTDEKPAKSYLNTNKILMQRIEAARQKAIDAGAQTTAPTLFKATEKIYETEKAIVDAGATEDLSTVLNDLLARYQGLENIAQAKELKDEIDENNFASFRQATYDEGKQLYTTLTNPLAVINSGADYNKDAAQAEADFRLVLKTAYSSLAKDERTAAYNAKLQADSVKAYISRKDAYTHAVSMYRNGELRRSVDPKAANESYKTAKEEFLVLYDEISKARAQAQKEIDDAKKRVTESESTAVKADKEAPLGNQPVEGIEDENAKLLEDDDFSNAEQPAEIEAPTEEPVGGEE
ncbi:MAG: hypothetical protein J5857_01445 [Treponema sp.]|nr:hypothetical protein [Treponema sp.]